MAMLQSALSAILEVLVNPMGLVDMGLNIISVRNSWKQHHHSLEAGERLHLEALKVSQSQHSEALHHGLSQHQESIFVSKDQHDQSLHVSRVMHDEALSRSKIQHEEQMKHSYMETRRENLRDLLSETLDEAQSTVLKSTLLFGFVVAVLVEGFPSSENSNERYIDVFIFSVSWAICLLFQSIVLAGLYQVVQTRALREMIRSLQAQASGCIDDHELRRSNTMDSSSSSLSDDWADLEREPVQRPRSGRPYNLLHPSSQRSARHKTEGADSFGSASTKDSSTLTSPSPVATLHVFDPKRLMYRSQAKKFVTVGSLFTLICLAGLIYGRLSMRRGSKYGEGAPDVFLRLGIFLPPFVSAMFSLLLRKNANPIRATLAVRSLAWLCFFVSLAFLLVTSVIWHAAAPSIKVAPKESDVVFLKGTSLEMPDLPMFFHPTGVAASGNLLLLSAAFRIARFEFSGVRARLVNEVTLPALEIGDLTFAPDNGTVALAGRDMVSYLPSNSLLETAATGRVASVAWRSLPASHFGIQDGNDPGPAEALQALAYWPQQDMLVISKADLGIVACKAHDDRGRVQPLVQAEMMVIEKFGLGTSVAGLHVDALEEVLYVLFHRTGRHAEIHAIDLRDELGRLLHVLRLPDLDSADGSEADHDVVWGALSSWHPPDPSRRPQLSVATRTPAKVFSFDLPLLRHCHPDGSNCKPR